MTRESAVFSAWTQGSPNRPDRLRFRLRIDAREGNFRRIPERARRMPRRTDPANIAPVAMFRTTGRGNTA